MSATLPAGYGPLLSLCTRSTKAGPLGVFGSTSKRSLCVLAGTDVLLMRLRDEDVEILEENQASSEHPMPAVLRP